jgi:hypothetical protein
MDVDFYADNTGVDASIELRVLRGLRPASAVDIIAALAAIKAGGAGHAFERSGTSVIYLAQHQGCFGFIRHAPQAPTKWLLVMFGAWLRDDHEQKDEAGRRFRLSGNL